MSNSVYVNSTIQAWARFRIRSTNTAFDPTNVRLIVKTPANVVTTYTYGTDVEITKSAAGHYIAALLVDAAGVWNWRWECDGTAEGATQGSVTVLPTNV